MMWLFISVWVICGVLNYGFTMAFAWNEWPLLHRKFGIEEWRKDQRIALIIGVTGIIGSAVVLQLNIYRHGLLYRRPNVKPL